MAFQLKFPSGVTASCRTSFNQNGLNSYRATAEKGWFELKPAYNYTGMRGSRSDGQSIDVPDVDQFAAEMDDFALCILNNKPTIVPGEEGLRDG